MKQKTLHRLMETVADIAFIAGEHHYFSGDSREDINMFIYLAKRFEEKFPPSVWEEEQLDYIEEITNFTIDELNLVNPLLFVADAATEQWDNIEIQKIKQEGDECYPLAPDSDIQENYWSVYLHRIEGGVNCIADVPTYEHAIALAKLIENAVKSFRQNVKFLHDIDAPNRQAIINAMLYLKAYQLSFSKAQSGYINV